MGFILQRKLAVQTMKLYYYSLLKRISHSLALLPDRILQMSITMKEKVMSIGSTDSLYAYLLLFLLQLVLVTRSMLFEATKLGCTYCCCYLNWRRRFIQSQRVTVQDGNFASIQGFYHYQLNPILFTKSSLRTSSFSSYPYNSIQAEMYQLNFFMTGGHASV